MKHADHTIIASVVVCTYNGEDRIKKCISSLLDQNYPKEQYEIIVVDDGSTDRTFEIISKLPVAVIRHAKNNGIAAARNTGLQHAKGSIYVCFDDDCFADREWLSNLLIAYKSKVAGACGITKNSTHGLVDRFLYEIGHGNPSPIIDSHATSLLQRLYFYLIDMYGKSEQKTLKENYEVKEIWGENSSFPVELLKSVGGWDVHVSGVEDTDLCARIRKISRAPFMCMTKAVIYHNGQNSLSQLLKKPYDRGYSTLVYYLKNHKTPPIFPFPIVTVIICYLLFTMFGIYGLFMSIFVPQFLYGWWLIKYIKTGRSYYLLFPYIQGGMELSTLAGLIRGGIKIFLSTA